MSKLQRLVLEFRDGELIARVLYRSSLDGPNPSTKARTRAVVNLTREGLRQALASLDSEDIGAECVGTSGFTQREDILLATTSSDALETVGQVKGA